MSDYLQGRMGYNEQTKRFGLLVADLWKIPGLHCGRTLEYWSSDKDDWIPTRLEMKNDSYYLIDTDIAGDDLEGLKVRIPLAED